MPELVLSKLSVGTFLLDRGSTYFECVCGKSNWGRQKQHELVSEATEKCGGCAKTVTISDEAFALLLFEN
jgi:hypothetical protein